MRRETATTGQSTGSVGSGGSGGSGDHAIARTGSVAVFWVGQSAYAIDIGMVGEVVVVEAIAPVPRARGGILGVFNLRGIPVALVSLSTVLSLPRAETAEAGATALVL